MDMPITKPSMVAYADELEFSQLLEDLSKTKKNGFIRVTSGSEDGYLLFKDGKQVAASYDHLSKLEAIDKIKLAMEDYKTLVEVFDIRPSQVSYLMDVNKPYLLEKVPEIEEVLEELKKDNEDGIKEENLEESEDTPQKTESEETLPATPEIEKPSEDTGKIPESQKETLDEGSKDTNANESSVTAEISSEDPTSEVVAENETSSTDSKIKIKDESPVSTDKVPDTGEVESTPTPVEKSPDLSAEIATDTVTETSPETLAENAPGTGGEVKTDLGENKPVETPVKDETSTNAPSAELAPVVTAGETSPKTEEEEPMDRLELLKKYGIKDIDEEDVEKVLESYTGGYLSDNDVEKVELTLMNRIKKSIMGLPKVKGTEVMIFLDNAGNDLRGNVNVIMEYQSQGFLSRIVGGSKEVNNLKRQVIGICNMEIRKIFREYPEVVDKFEINVEIS
ncbi:MAG: DUF2226 domain-containing protein [Methanobacteriaceae archaeon]